MHNKVIPNWRNWIERLNRKYKRTINMRTSMPSEKSIIFLLAAVAMEETKTTYGRRIYQFKSWKEKNKKGSGRTEKRKMNYTLLRTLPCFHIVFLIFLRSYKPLSQHVKTALVL